MSHYNIIAGKNIQRIEAISDGVFAVVMTLLVLDIKVPVQEVITTEAGAAHLFGPLIPKLLIYFLSFMTCGIFWTGQSAQFHFIKKSDRNLNWISLIFLFFVSTVPFTTAFLSEYISFRFSIFVYWLNILFLGSTLYINWQYASKKDFLSISGIEKNSVDAAIRKRIIIAQSLYALGSLCCFISIYLSIAIIIAIQLNYAFAIVSPSRTKKIST